MDQRLLKRALDITLLQKGDCILYRPHDVFDWAIAVKTWTKVSHIEIYAGDGETFASRNWVGVNVYKLRRQRIAAILRPKQLDWTRAEQWFFRAAKGQKYDWKGILCFTLAVRQGARNKMFCSEFATRFYRKGGSPVFASWWDADRTPPSLFLATNELSLIWDDGDLF